jgi:hypothetical protein
VLHPPQLPEGDELLLVFLAAVVQQHPQQQSCRHFTSEHRLVGPQSLLSSLQH